MNDIAVSVEKLTKKFGDFTAVNGIDFSVKRGEIFGFLGPNGAGKTTTIKMLCGLLLPTRGRGSVGGYDIMTESENIKKNIGYMSQKFSLYDDLTVEENINFFSGIYSVPPEKKDERKKYVLNMAHISERKSDLTRNLPVGFKQRLALGCAILHEPPVLFLDEPTSGVDPASRRNFWNLIYDMSRKGTTVFVTTHYMDEAEYCNRLALIYKGEIIAIGTPLELKEKYMKKDILELDIDDVIGAMKILSENKIDNAVFGSLLHLTVNNAEEDMIKIKNMLNAGNIKINKIEKIAPTLEDVFVNLIEEKQ